MTGRKEKVDNSAPLVGIEPTTTFLKGTTAWAMGGGGAEIVDCGNGSYPEEDN